MKAGSPCPIRLRPVPWRHNGLRTVATCRGSNTGYADHSRPALCSFAKIRTITPTPNRYCRICWNTAGWRAPSLAARDLASGSYVATHGFGHKEWLFNYEWLVDGWRYAFLQPINKNRAALLGTSFDILLYTYPPDAPPHAVGIISDAYVSYDSEVNEIAEEYRRRHWLTQMEAAIASLGLDGSIIAGSPAHEIVIVRFSPEKVDLFSPLRSLAPDHPLNRRRRYQLYKWSENHPRPVAGTPASHALKSEDPRTRSAIRQTTHDPWHDRMQNRLLEHLEAIYSNVRYEAHNVDLAFSDGDIRCLVEVKAYPTARRCIREALDQILENAHYPPTLQWTRLLVVGDVPLTRPDRAYLQMLRSRYNLPIYYRGDSESYITQIGVSDCPASARGETRTRTGVASLGILSPMCLPVSPPGPGVPNFTTCLRFRNPTHPWPHGPHHRAAERRPQGLPALFHGPGETRVRHDPPRPRRPGGRPTTIVGRHPNPKSRHGRNRHVR